jgi:hypothetical protein
MKKPTSKPKGKPEAEAAVTLSEVVTAVDPLDAHLIRARLAMSFDHQASYLRRLVSDQVDVKEITDRPGLLACHKARQALKQARISTEAKGTEARADAVAFQKAVVEVERELIAIVLPEEERLRALQAGWDSIRDAEREKKVEAEKQRIADLVTNATKERDAEIERLRKLLDRKPQAKPNERNTRKAK